MMHPVTDPTDSDDGCPGCGTNTGVQSITGTSPRVQTWSCAACTTRWAITVVNPSLQPYLDCRAATVEQLGRLRWLLGQVVILGADANGLTDEQLRARLLALADSVKGQGVQAEHPTAEDQVCS